MMILLDAVYINQSGGKVLLEYFLECIIDQELDSYFYFLLDKRLESSVINKLKSNKLIQIDASESNRRTYYKHLEKNISAIFCFANVPPAIIQKDKKVTILFHNALILHSKNMDYNLIGQIKFFLKRLYIKRLADRSYTWIVQTKNMAQLLSDVLTIRLASIKVLPFYDENRFKNVNCRLDNNNNNFLYVADGVKQKNHQKLIDAWEIVFDRYKLPIQLHLTIPPKYISLINEIERLKKKGVQIINHGHCNLNELRSLYETCNYYLSPSLAESFGLPIIESAEAGCEVVSADLDYVYDIVKPLATFDPLDAFDISKVIISIYNKELHNKTQLLVKSKIDEIIKLITTNV